MSIRKLAIGLSLLGVLSPAFASAETSSTCNLSTSPTITQLQACIVELQAQIDQLLNQAGSGLHGGDRVKAETNLKVRLGPSTSAGLVGTVPAGSIGTIRCDLGKFTVGDEVAGCPANKGKDDYRWWYIKWDVKIGTTNSIPPNPIYLTGWSAQGTKDDEVDFLSKVRDNGATGDPVFITTSLPNAVINEYYSVNISAMGGTGSYSWSISSGSLPPGLTLEHLACAAVGTAPCQVPVYITGTPTTAGVYTFTVQLSVGDTGSISKTFVVSVNQTGGQQGTTGSGRIQATLNGVSWNGTVTLHSRTPDGVERNSTLTLPALYPNVPVGNYTFSNISGPTNNSSITVAGGASCGTGCGTLTSANTSSNPLIFTLAFEGTDNHHGGTTPPANCPAGFTCTPIGGTGAGNNTVGVHFVEVSKECANSGTNCSPLAELNYFNQLIWTTPGSAAQPQRGTFSIQPDGSRGTAYATGFPLVNANQPPGTYTLGVLNGGGFGFSGHAWGPPIRITDANGNACPLVSSVVVVASSLQGGTNFISCTQTLPNGGAIQFNVQYCYAGPLSNC